MDQRFDQLKELLAEISDLNTAASLLRWDQQTYMPRGGAAGRGQQLATLESLAHDRLTSPEIGGLLEQLQPVVEGLDPASDEACLVRQTARQFHKEVHVPSEWVVKFAQVSALAQTAWQEARAENNYARFQPYLRQIVDLRRSYADYFAPYQHVYDPLLDDFEPGLKTTEVKEIFAILRPQQVELIKRAVECGDNDGSFLWQPYDPQKQWDFGVEVITAFGYDWNRGRQDKAPHPFASSFGIGDVRITTRISPDYLGTYLFGTFHEAGHAMYEQGIDPSLARSPLGTGISLAIHESQSRMWENFVGRSLPFWEYYYPRLQKVFPDQLGSVGLEAFYKGINRINPSLIRVEADEATYNLHIMLRLELEIAMLDGSLQIEDMPDAWNTRMSEYLGIVPPTDSDGVLQDIHWSLGILGYFPTYALGNLVAAQLWERINSEITDLDQQFRQGDFSGLLGWLHQNIHRHGAKFEPQELLMNVTGSKINPAPYLRYLNAKYGRIYGF